MRKFVWLSMLILTTLCGCVRSKPITGPDGTQVYSIECNGIQNTIADCLEKAGEVCGARGYSVLGADKEFSSTATAFYTGNPNNPLAYVPTNRFNRNLLIQCK